MRKAVATTMIDPAQRERERKAFAELLELESELENDVMRYEVYDTQGRVVARFVYRSDAIDFAESYFFTWGGYIE